MKWRKSEDLKLSELTDKFGENFNLISKYMIRHSRPEIVLRYYKKIKHIKIKGVSFNRSSLAVKDATSKLRIDYSKTEFSEPYIRKNEKKTDLKLTNKCIGEANYCKYISYDESTTKQATSYFGDFYVERAFIDSSNKGYLHKIHEKLRKHIII